MFVLNSQQTYWVDGQCYYECDCAVPMDSSGCVDLLGCPSVGFPWTFTGARGRALYSGQGFGVKGFGV